MKPRLSVFLLSVSAVLISLAHADERLQRLVRETETILASLPEGDAARAPLSLRLGDLLYEAIIDLQKDVDITPANAKLLEAERKRAIALYTRAIQESSGERRTKIQFQLARIYTDMGENGRALALWREIYNQKTLPLLRQEAALRLADSVELNRDANVRAEAESLYKEAVRLCTNDNNCSYSKYRYAWYLHNHFRSQEAAATMKETVFDAHARVRDESLRDWILMLGRLPGDGKEGLAELQPVATQLNRPDLYKSLSESYYSSGNKIAGTALLEVVGRENGDAQTKIRLLEELYGFRRWADFRKNLDDLTQMTAAGLTKAKLGTAEEAQESEKILRRLSVQLDGERQGDKERVEEFKGTVLLYLSLFPFTPERPKMIDGWLAAETDLDKRIAQLPLWIKQSKDKRPQGYADEVRFREMRADAAQKQKRNDVLIEEAKALTEIMKSKEYGEAPSKKRDDYRKYRYILARTEYDAKNYDAALPIFLELAEPQKIKTGATMTTVEPDTWAIQSLNLALDIYGQQKDFRAVRATTGKWTQNSAYASLEGKDAKFGKEMADLRAIALKSEFQEAAEKGDSKEALATFLRQCEEGKLTPKSCENAKILSVRLKDQAALLRVLKTQKNPQAMEELTNELEASAYFAEAASLLEPKLVEGKKRAPLADALRVALLYELGGNLKKRNDVQLAAIKGLPPAEFQQNEEVIALSLKDMGKLDESALGMPFSAPFKMKIAHELVGSAHERRAAAPKRAQALLLSATEFPGPQWTRLKMEELNPLVTKEASISIAGKNSRAKFEARLKVLKLISAFSKKNLPVGDAAARVQIAGVVRNAYAGFVGAILESPIPDEAQGEVREQLVAALKSLADPFDNEAKLAAKIADEQLAMVQNPEAKQELQAWLQSGALTPAKTVADLGVTTTQAAARTSAPKAESGRDGELIALQKGELIRNPIQALHDNPDDTSALQSLEGAYQGSGFNRLAAYFKGRAQSTNKPKAEKQS